ncbi:calcium-binding and coiled-coil domain-containing protein 2-like [Mytilus edulis]|uniref:calcium-binding and coiled-coil domain-containing protein 2-like n=1 Tax=Mytilus edulis TaxID=6550 RepID=UPI0039F14CEE
MWLFVLTVLSCICFGFLLDVSSRKAESMDEDFVKRIDVTVEALASNYHNLLKTVIKDRSEIDSLIKQNQDLNQRLYKAEDKIEELKTNEEFSNQTIQTLQTITLELQRELKKEKYMSKKLTTNYNDLLLKVNCEVAFLKKQNLNLKRKLNTTEEKMEKLMSAEETSNQIIENLQNITSQQQHELNKAKSESKKSRLSVISSLTLLNNSLQELTISTSIGFKHLNGSVVKEKQLLIVREEMQKFERRINNRLGKIGR